MKSKQYVLVLVLAVVAGVIGGLGTTRVFREKVIEAEKFLVVDRDGNTHAEFGMWPHFRPDRARMPTLRLMDESGRVRASLGLAVDGAPSLTLTDENEKLSASILFSKWWGDNRSPVFLVADGNTKASAALNMSPDGMAGLRLMDKNARVRATLTLAQDGSPEIFFMNEEGKITWHEP